MPIPLSPGNRLRDATSPYLEQHADNPVDWWPWCEEALQLARERDRPILLSIGYSACHWCHVMAHESFEDEETAELMNRLFINIKIDREERPDLDRIYQNAHQLLARRAGGWPLTAFLNPHDHTPYFCGTYFPKQPRHGLPSFKDLLVGTEQAYRQQMKAIEEQGQSLRDALLSLGDSERGEAALTDAPIRLAREHLWESFDHRYGGFGAAPKFPHTSSLELLLVHWADSVRDGEADDQALHMVVHSLERMALSGLCDQIGGGFYRYAVDERWEIPHFEKMLYDNGLLLSLYGDAWQVTGSPLFKRTIEKTAGWVLREMQSPLGGYYSSLDADSEGQEGQYYVWSDDELAALLDKIEYDLFSLKFALSGNPNFEGQWHLHARMDNAGLAELSALDAVGVEALLSGAEDRLFQARERRVHPGCDDKILTAWNALMIKGMARAARLLNRQDLQASAEAALNFIRENLWRDGRLFASWRGGRAVHPAYLDDYAFLLDALLEMLQLRWRDQDLDFAKEIAGDLLAHFEDNEVGGFFFTADDHEALIQRPKPWTDDAMPCGNGVAAHALNRLGHLVSEPRYLVAADRVLKAVQGRLDHSPSAYGALLLGLKEQLVSPELIIIQGSDAGQEEWVRQELKDYSPHRLCFSIPPSAVGPAVAQANPGQEGVCAVICRGTHCLAPVNSIEDFRCQLTVK